MAAAVRKNRAERGTQRPGDTLHERSKIRMTAQLTTPAAGNAERGGRLSITLSTGRAG